MNKLIINDTNTENIGKFIATQSRFNSAVKELLNIMVKKYSLDDVDNYLIEWMNNELTAQEDIRWDII